jgi:glycosyltransferase involved in cell wall biosynthesis
LFAFPSRTDTLGQVVMESQACGLPALVSDEGGPKTIVRDGVTGRIVRGNDAAAWCHEIEELIDDAAARRQMSTAAIEHLRQFCFAETFDHFWHEHEATVMTPVRAAAKVLVSPPHLVDASSELGVAL